MKLVRNARQAWKWFSVQAMAASAALQGAWLAMPVDLKTVVPDAWVTGAAVGLLVLGVVGRLVDQGGSNGAD